MAGVPKEQLLCSYIKGVFVCEVAPAPLYKIGLHHFMNSHHFIYISTKIIRFQSEMLHVSGPFKKNIFSLLRNADFDERK